VSAPKRWYRVEDVTTVVGVGYVRARSKAEAVELALNGDVQLDYDDGGTTIRRGDGPHVYVADRTERRYLDADTAGGSES